MSYLVTQRTREIGIRLALGPAGATSSGSWSATAPADRTGIVIGLAASFALQRLVDSLLFGVSAAYLSSGVAVLLLAFVAMLACYLPALRATRVDPLHALRQE